MVRADAHICAVSIQTRTPGDNTARCRPEFARARVPWARDEEAVSPHTLHQHMPAVPISAHNARVYVDADVYEYVDV